MNITGIVTLFALAAVAAVLGMGLFNMIRGGNPNLSQKLMRARVIAQAVAIVLILAALFLFGRGS
jgi:hypothetical protein